MKTVLDASALLAYLHREPGWDQVRTCIADSCIGAVNWCEVAQKSARSGVDVGRARVLLEDVGLAIVPFTAGQAQTAALLWEPTREKGLSLADRACLALAMDRAAPVLTADRDWAGLDLDVDVRLIR